MKTETLPLETKNLFNTFDKTFQESYISFKKLKYLSKRRVSQTILSVSSVQYSPHLPDNRENYEVDRFIPHKRQGFQPSFLPQGLENIFSFPNNLNFLDR